MQPNFKRVAVLDLLLNRENPRHVPKTGQPEIIKYLLANEEVYNLARHISANGVNPLEVSAVFPDEDGNLVVAEGNRRICAAQLLADPDKAPEADRARFRALRAKGVDVSHVTVMEFPDYATAQPWLQVLHDGEQDGVGRRRWKPEQKSRATTNKSTNALAVALTDYAERQQILTGEARQKLLLSTVTRYLANPGVRRAMGLSHSSTTDQAVVISTDSDRFNRILSDFYDGVTSRRLHSRSKTRDWNEYAKHLEETFKAPENVIEPVNVTEIATAPKKPSKRRARIVPPDTRFIAPSPAVVDLLNELGSFKLGNLYHSLTTVRLDEHPALTTSGAWVFLETLAVLHGSTTEFVGYIAGKYGGWGISKEAFKVVRLSLEYIQSHGNAQKHSALFTAIDARNLHIHFQVIEPVLVALIGECIANQGSRS